MTRKGFIARHQPLAFAFIGLSRLAVEQLFELGIAIVGVVSRRTADIILVELLVRVVDAAASQIEADFVIFTIHFGVPKGRLDDIEFAFNEHILQLVDKNNRRIAKRRDVARRHTFSASRLSGP